MLKQRIILVAEDDSPHRGRLLELLVRDGYEVVAASNGEDVLSAVTQINPIALLLDVQLKMLNGGSVIRSLRSHPRFAGLCVIALSSNARNIEKALIDGFDDCIAKPVDQEDLALIVSEQILPSIRSRRLPASTWPRIA